MTLHKRIVVGDLLETHPGARDLFSWYGVPLDGHARRMTLEELCDAEGLDVDDALAELAVDDDDDAIDYEDPDEFDHDDDWFDEE